MIFRQTMVVHKYLFSSTNMNPNAGIPRVISAKAFIAGYTRAKPVAARVGTIANMENLFLSFLNTVGKYLLGKNIQKPAM